MEKLCSYLWNKQDCRIYFPIEEAEKKKYLLWLEDLVDKRVKAIVGGKFNNHYGSVAQLASAMGEVKESWEKKGQSRKFYCIIKRHFQGIHLFMKRLECRVEYSEDELGSLKKHVE